MSKKKDEQYTGVTSPDAMCGWLQEEVRDVMKEWELRIKDATEFVTEYATGRLPPKEAEERLNQYDRRWHDALYGHRAGFKTDEELIAAIDKRREENRRAERERYKQLLRRGDATGPSR